MSTVDYEHEPIMAEAKPFNFSPVMPTEPEGMDEMPEYEGSICPECLVPTTQEELDMFGGLCEECSGAFY